MRKSPSRNSIFASPASTGRRSNLFIAGILISLVYAMVDATREPRRKRPGQEIARLVKARQLALRGVGERAGQFSDLFEAPASKYRIIRAGTRSRQQCRSSPQGPQEEDAAGGNLSRNEASRTLREAFREEGARKG